MRTLLRLLHCWWTRDRIRGSLQEGRLLRLQPGCVVCVDCQVLEVVQRRVLRSPTGRVVVYRCMSGQEPCELRVRPGDHRCWLGREAVVEVAEVQVFSPR